MFSLGQSISTLPTSDFTKEKTDEINGLLEVPHAPKQHIVARTGNSGPLLKIMTKPKVMSHLVRKAVLKMPVLLSPRLDVQ